MSEIGLKSSSANHKELLDGYLLVKTRRHQQNSVLTAHAWYPCVSKESSDPSAIDVAAGLYTTARTMHHYTVLHLSFTSKHSFATVNFALFGTITVRTLINLWTSFHKNGTAVRFQEIPICLSCFLSELNHLAWVTCLSTSTQAGRWWPESRFYAPNIGSQTTWDNFF